VPARAFRISIPWCRGIGRLQPLVTIEAAVDRLRRVGLGNLSFDLMYGLPLQTLESIRKTCAFVVALSHCLLRLCAFSPAQG